jgi:hypothetical protein
MSQIQYHSTRSVSVQATFHVANFEENNNPHLPQETLKMFALNQFPDHKFADICAIELCLIMLRHKLRNILFNMTSVVFLCFRGL